MDENEIDKASHRANMIEQRMFDITLASIETLKHATAIELHRSQNEMKKRLRRYRDRQREIVRSDPNYDKDPIDDLITRQMENRAKARNARPKTSLGISTKNNTSKSTQRSANSKIAKQQDSDSDSDITIDGTFMIDQQKSKIDLRPKTAIDIVRRGITLAAYVQNGRLGPQVCQVRYFDEDEVRDRGHFYQHLVKKRITAEKSNLQTLDDKVAKFCGSETTETKSQSKHKYFTPTIEREDSTVSNQSTAKSPIVVQKADVDSTNQEKPTRIPKVRPNTTTGVRHVSSFEGLQSPVLISTP